MREVDVLIVGAGPSGLMMAAELSRYGLFCRIVDKNSGPVAESRAAGIQARSVEIFDHIGIVPRFLEEGLAVSVANPMYKGRPIAQIDFKNLESPYPFILCLEQNKTEKILIDHLASFGVEVERNTEVMSLKQDDTGADAQLLCVLSGKQETVRAAWIIGCDGSKSFVRKTMRLSFSGKTFSDIFSLADVKIRWKYPHDELFAFPNPEGIIAAFPLPGKHRYRLIFQLPRCRGLLSKKKALTPADIGAIELPTLHEIDQMLRRCALTEIEISDPTWLTHFHINSRMASSYREGRFFLVGDAAHIHSPVGAQGMNTGLQDAFNLAWKLAFVMKKRGHITLLDTYHLERHGFGKALLKWTQRASWMVCLHNFFLVFLRNYLMSWMLQNHCAQKKVVKVISQTAICYPYSAIVKKGRSFREGPTAGVRLPNAALLWDNTSTDLYTLLRNPTSYFLLLFGDTQISNSMRNAIACMGGLAVVSFLIMKKVDRIENILGVSILLDLKGVVHAEFGVDREAAYLIRPDLYIGYRQSPIDTPSLLGYLKGVFQLQRI